MAYRKESMDIRSERNFMLSSEILDYKYYTDKTWRCGNPKKRRDLVAKFAKTSSLTGAAHMYASNRKCPSLCIKIIYRVLFFLCLWSVISHIVSLLKLNLNQQSTIINSIIKDTKTGLEEDPDYFPLYPRITICRKPYYRTDFTNITHLRLVEYVLLVLGYPFSVLSLDEKTKVLNFIEHQMGITDHVWPEALEMGRQLEIYEEKYKILKSTDDFDLKKFIIKESLNCSEFFISCVVLLFAFDCCTMFEPVLTSEGLCYTLRDVSRVSDIVVHSPLPSSVKLDLPTPLKPDKRSEYGFAVYLTDPTKEVPILFDELDGQLLIPGLSTTISAELIKTGRTALYTPWHGFGDNCPKWWDSNSSQETDKFSQIICGLHAYEDIIGRVCGCKSVYNSRSSNLRICEPMDMFNCTVRIELSDTITSVIESCVPPCVVYSYKTETKYIPIGDIVGNVSRLTIMYNAKRFTYNEYRKSTFANLLSQIGGSMGLYLGASIITLAEIFTFTVTWLWYRLAPAKVAKKSKLFSSRKVT